jgi:hypothetical protein
MGRGAVLKAVFNHVQTSPTRRRRQLKATNPNLKRLAAAFLLLAALFSQAAAQDPPILVIPLKVVNNGEKSHPWLGRAVSFYVTEGLELNQFPVMSDSAAAALLESHSIYFPYAMTKATVLRLAIEEKQGIVIWGEISSDPQDKTLIAIRASIIHINGFKQKHLPLLKGHVNDLYKLMAELLKSIVKSLQAVEDEERIIPVPSIHLNLRQFERFIKSRLLNEHPVRA